MIAFNTLAVVSAALCEDSGPRSYIAGELADWLPSNCMPGLPALHLLLDRAAMR